MATTGKKHGAFRRYPLRFAAIAACNDLIEKGDAVKIARAAQDRRCRIRRLRWPWGVISRLGAGRDE
jgi:hypothetical protein